MAQRRALPWWTTGVVLVLAMALVLLPEPARHVEAFGSHLIAPVQNGISAFAEGIGAFWSTVQHIGQLARENREYRDEVDRLQAETVRMNELELENRDLRSLLGLKQRSAPGELIPVRVIGRDPSPYVQAITIDRGAQDGLHVGMTVITWRGLVGRVIRTEPITAKVLLITDVNSSIAGRIQSPESRATGVLRGRTEGGLLMQHIPQDEPIDTGELIITSDLGALVPEGLVVGRIIQVRRKDVDVFQEAIVEPAVEIGKLERLFVISDHQNGRSE